MPKGLTRGTSGAKGRPKKVIYGTAEEAAEKRLKQVNSTFCATTIQQLTSDSWVKKRPKLLLWFIFQQPLQPCRNLPSLMVASATEDFGVETKCEFPQGLKPK